MAMTNAMVFCGPPSGPEPPPFGRELERGVPPFLMRSEKPPMVIQEGNIGTMRIYQSHMLHGAGICTPTFAPKNTQFCR